MIDHKAGDMRMVTVEAVMPDGSEVMIKGCNRWIGTTALHPLPEPAPDPYAELRDAVVEAAQRHRSNSTISSEIDLWNAVDALNAAMKPPDLLGELLAASRAAVVLTGYCHADRERLRAAIAAVEAERRV